jgi:VIT1/CCC1 family predicted Fe2+/Mn2+ transporter
MRPLNSSEFKNPKYYIFGSAAAIITNTSLIVGLGSARAGKGPILGSLLTIALADNISDTLGMHLYKETERGGERLSVFPTALNFFSRLLVSSSFIAIVLVFSISQAIPVATVWGLLLLTLLSYIITKSNNANSMPEIAKHVLVAVVVIVLSRWVGHLIAEHF